MICNVCDENDFYDEDGHKVPPAEVRKMKEHYRGMSSDELRKIWGPLPITSDLGMLISDILHERGEM